LVKVTTYIHKPTIHFRTPGDLYLPRRPCWRLDQGRLRYLCSHLAAASWGPPTPPNAFAGGIQRPHHPTPNRWSVPPNAHTTQRPKGGPCHPTPKSVTTQRPILNTQRPKKFLPLRGIFLYRGFQGSVGTPRGVWWVGGGSGLSFPPLWGRRRRGRGRRRGGGRRRGRGEG
jgi:hypothetical protein